MFAHHVYRTYRQYDILTMTKTADMKMLFMGIERCEMVQASVMMLSVKLMSTSVLRLLDVA